MRQVSGSKKGARLAGYAAGILFLAASLLCAFFLPDMYSRWQEEQLLNWIHMDDRPVAKAPEEKEKEVAGKMLLLCDSDWFELRASYTMADMSALRVSADWHARLAAQVGEWIRFGLLPESFAETFASCQGRLVHLYTCEDTGLSLLWMRYEGEDGLLLDFIMDEEGVCLYYVCCYGGDEEGGLWNGRLLTELAAQEDAFRLREYCQADRIDNWDGEVSDLVSAVYTSEEGSVSVDILYVSLALDDRENDEWLRGDGLALGGAPILSLAAAADSFYGRELSLMVAKGSPYYDLYNLHDQQYTYVYAEWIANVAETERAERMIKENEKQSGNN